MLCEQTLIKKNKITDMYSGGNKLSPRSLSDEAKTVMMYT